MWFFPLVVFAGLLFYPGVSMANVNQSINTTNGEEIKTTPNTGMYLGTGLSGTSTQISFNLDCISFHTTTCGYHDLDLVYYDSDADFLSDTGETTVFSGVSQDGSAETSLGLYTIDFSIPTTSFDNTKYYALRIHCVSTCGGVDVITGSADDVYIGGRAYSNGVYSSSKTEDANVNDYSFIIYGANRNYDEEVSLVEDYIIITDPVESAGHANVAYSDTFTLQINNTNNSTSSYIVNFVSQSGELYPSVTGSTTSSFPFSTTTNISFDKDDIIFVKALLYNGEYLNNRIDSSPEYEWWVSANANPNQRVDLAMFRTGTTTFCGESQGALDFAWGTCMALRLLFVPNESSLNYISDQFAEATSTVPFSYMYEMYDLFNDLYSRNTTTAWVISLPTSTPVFGDITILDSSVIDSSANYQIIKTAMITFLYLGLIGYLYRRSISLARSL